jgi:hypothetical protein
VVSSELSECERCGQPFEAREYELLCPSCEQAEAGRLWPDKVTDRIVHGIGHLTVAALIVWVLFALLESSHVIK